jgi:urease accessory protein
MSASMSGVTARAMTTPDGSVAPQAAIRFERDPAGRTFLARQFTTYPFFCTAPFHLDRAPRGMLTTILQSSSGGLYEGERLALTVDVEPGAEAHVTTQGATVAHPMPHGGEARHEVRIHTAAGSLLEYLPDPLILLPTASVLSRVEVVAEAGATVIVGDAFLTHDPVGRRRPFRRFVGELTFRRPGASPFVIERFDVTGEDVERAWHQLVPHRCAAQGSLFICSPGSPGELAASLAVALAPVAGLHAGASPLAGGEGVMARLLATDAVALANGFRAAWHALRRALTGQPPASRRHSGWL